MAYAAPDVKIARVIFDPHLKHTEKDSYTNYASALRAELRLEVG